MRALPCCRVPYVASCLLLLVKAAIGALPEEAVFVPGTLPLDTDGKEVHAHGGGILMVKDTFYWFGESYKRPLLGDFLSEGVGLYSSTDLMTWHNEGLVFNGTAQITGLPCDAPYRIERPKIVYNKEYGRYVLLFHADTPKFSFPSVGVAYATEITGPYVWVHAFKPDGLGSYDMGVFQDDDGSTYLVRSVNNQYMGISQLTPDFTNTMGLVSTAPQGEGPALYKTGPGSYFLLASHLTGWAPNPPQLFAAAADSIAQTNWQTLPTPASGKGANITYNSQPTFVLPLEFEDGTVLYIYMGDRWNFYGHGKVERASYVWLPLLPRSDGLGFELSYYSSWRPVDFRSAARVRVSANATIADLGTTTGPETFGPRVGAGIGAQPEGMQPIGAAAEVTPRDPPEGKKT